MFLLCVVVRCISITADYRISDRERVVLGALFNFVFQYT